jgi:uncharacterized C2H2 Zn-finger protein
MARARQTPTTPLAETIASLDPDHIQCRDFGHSWTPYAARWIPKDREYESVLRCTRCQTLRTRRLSRTGQLIANHYGYSDGYLLRGIGRMTSSDRDTIRVASVLITIGKDVP